MSYILDALRKAERERGIKQVPTLVTDHAPRSANRNRTWAAVGILVACGAVVAGYLMLSQKTIAPRPDAGSSAQSNERVEEMDQSAGTASGITAGASIPDTSLKLPEQQKSGPATEKTAESAVASQSHTASGHAAEKRPGETARRVPPQTEEEIFVSPEEEEEEENVPIPDIVRNQIRARGTAGLPPPPQSQPASLREAISKMTLSLLLFADTKEERIVFINGKRYREGEYVEGIYLLESITMDGALLSYQGERALLQPKSK